ncbi:hypothetical protein D3C75_812350 [compost metagenome]
MGRECVEVIDKGGVGGAVDAVPEIAGNARRRRDCAPDIVTHRDDAEQALARRGGSLGQVLQQGSLGLLAGIGQGQPVIAGKILGVVVDEVVAIGGESRLIHGDQTNDRGWHRSFTQGKGVVTLTPEPGISQGVGRECRVRHVQQEERPWALFF